jgi:hypothetical protein
MTLIALLLLILNSGLLVKIEPEITVLKHQEQFARNREKNCAIVGGFGSGKSQGAVFRALDRLEWRDYAIFVLIAPTYQLLQDVNIPDFREIFDHYCISYQEIKSEKKIIVDSGNLKGEIWFRSADKPEKIVGFDATDIDIDEFDILKVDKQKELWRKCLGRLRGAENATISISTTPEGFRETYRLFQKEKIGPLIRAKTTDNHFLPDDFIQELYSQYDEMLVRQYVNAEFVNINGLMAYYAFNRDKNHRQTPANEHKDYPYIGIGWDFNVNKMCAELFVHNEHQQKLHFFDEFIIKGTYGNEPLTERMCKIIKEKYPTSSLRAFPDSTGRSKSTNASISDIQIIERNGIPVYARSSNPFVRDRLNAANAKFGNLSITVDTKQCPDLTEDLEQTERDKYGDIDKSDAERSHSSDAATYPVAYLYPLRRQGGIIKRAV